MLVDAEVGQMDEPFAHVLCLDVVLVGGEAGQALFEHVDPQGIVTSHHYVYPEVVFEVVYEVGVEDVLRDQHVLLVPDFGVLCHHFYSTPAGLVGRLHDP